ncbi:hypothetical protein C8035_v002026 [Colletotrichum spinosum]|uniref:Rhodopsin domain-containing protein n=1 Tax=Colletotrichum spinosum TaxID=1347390 RepID=A0A4R8Q1M5_9PEZI|nr:hypothetical protein C8035_v002026 [Colletotrichum spinosum]
MSTVLYLADVVFACFGAMSGLGTRNADLNETMMAEAIKWLMIWMLVYVAALCLVKTSICVTILRIATTMPRLRAAVYLIMGLTIATFITMFTGILLLCRPVEANWDQNLISEGRGECSPVYSMLGLSYTSTASTIVTDLACAVLPAAILWRTQMKLSTKIMVATFLSFGSFASVSTMIRTPYIDHFSRPTDDLAFHIANIPQWSNVETAIGLVAGSLPALRQLFNRKRALPHAAKDAGHTGSAGIVTIGGSGRALKAKASKSLHSGYDASASGQDEWSRLDEESVSDKGSTSPIKGIRKDVTFEIEMLPHPGNKVGAQAE